MDPIGASPTWRWHGYENSWITLDGARVQSVSGGGHWGGGMFLSARDQARFGLFTLRRGNWGGTQLLDEAWFDLAITPTGAQPNYGFMNYFLNVPDADGNKRYPSAPDAAYAHLGNGTNMVYVDPENDLVVVARWIRGNAIDEFLGTITRAVRNQAAPVRQHARRPRGDHRPGAFFHRAGISGRMTGAPAYLMSSMSR